MKFKWIGANRVKDLDLVLAGVLNPNDELKKGMIIDIPDSKAQIIERVQVNGNYEVYVEPKKVVKPKKVVEPKKANKPKTEKETKKEDK